MKIKNTKVMLTQLVGRFACPLPRNGAAGIGLILWTLIAPDALGQSAEEIAKELANPNTALATLTLKNQHRTFEGDLPNAGDQDSFTMVFQPALPFVLESGAKVFFQPAIPIVSDQPLFNAETGDFDAQNGLGDIAFDLAYAPVTAPGTIVAYGLISGLPTGTDGVTSDRWTLGPEFLYGKLTEKYVAGFFPNHQWDVGGSGDADINLTTIQPFYTYLPGVVRISARVPLSLMTGKAKNGPCRCS
jgi:hypothetical protein